MLLRLPKEVRFIIYRNVVPQHVRIIAQTTLRICHLVFKPYRDSVKKNSRSTRHYYAYQWRHGLWFTVISTFKMLVKSLKAILKTWIRLIACRLSQQTKVLLQTVTIITQVSYLLQPFSRLCRLQQSRKLALPLGRKTYSKMAPARIWIPIGAKLWRIGDRLPHLQPRSVL